MASFFVALWESIFQPGTSPQLIVATHVSFALLLCVLGSQIYLTKNIHFIALAVIAALLWVTVTWFIYELNRVKLQSNEDIARAQEKTGSGSDSASDKKLLSSSTSHKPTADSNSPKPRKTKSRRAWTRTWTRTWKYVYDYFPGEAPCISPSIYRLISPII